MFLKISKNSQENTYVRVSFLIKLQDLTGFYFCVDPEAVVWRFFLKTEQNSTKTRGWCFIIINLRNNYIFNDGKYSRNCPHSFISFLLHYKYSAWSVVLNKHLRINWNVFNGVNGLKDFKTTSPLFIMQPTFWIITVSGEHLGFSEGRSPDFRKGANKYKRKRNKYKSYVGDNFLIIRSYKIRYVYDCR